MSATTLAFNPYLPFWEYVPDAEPRVFGDRLYAYGSHDRPNCDVYCLEDYVVWSAPVDDLGAWRLEGVSFRRTDDVPHRTMAPVLCAPDVVQGPDGRFYLYYCNDMATISVAAADAPAGPFSYAGIVRDEAGEPLSGGIPFDPAVLVDETGAWLYYGYDASKSAGAEAAGVSGCFVVKLADDMVTMAGSSKKIAPGRVEAAGTPYEGHAFFEASSMRRVGDTYYLVYSSELGHELCYATSAAPDGPFDYQGTIVSISDVGYRGNTEPVAYEGNTHGGMVEVGGQWYIFYHRHTHERQYSRQGCAEPIEILPDGTIPQVEITSCGLNGGPLPTRRAYPVHIACGIRGPEGVVHLSSRVHRRPSDPYLYLEGGREGGCLCARNLRDGASLTFKYFDFDGCEDTCSVDLRGSFAGSVEVLAIDRAGNATPWGEIAVACAPGAQWTAYAGTMDAREGVFGIRLAFHGEGAVDCRAICLEEAGCDDAR